MNAKQLAFLKEILSTENYEKVIAMGKKTKEPVVAVEKVQCSGLTKKNEQCKKSAKYDGLCASHGGPKHSDLHQLVANVATASN